MFANAHHRAAETRFLALVQDASLPLPDRTEYGPDTVTFYWEEPRAAVIVELDDVTHDGSDRLADPCRCDSAAS